MNKNHDQQGRFSSGSDAGAATGDHAAVSPRLDVRNVSGRAVPRSKPITRHAGVPSVGTDKPRFIAVAGGLKPAVPTRGLVRPHANASRCSKRLTSGIFRRRPTPAWRAKQISASRACRAKGRDACSATKGRSPWQNSHIRRSETTAKQRRRKQGHHCGTPKRMQFCARRDDRRRERNRAPVNWSARELSPNNNGRFQWQYKLRQRATDQTPECRSQSRRRARPRPTLLAKCAHRQKRPMEWTALAALRVLTRGKR